MRGKRLILRGRRKTFSVISLALRRRRGRRLREPRVHFPQVNLPGSFRNSQQELVGIDGIEGLDITEKNSRVPARPGRDNGDFFGENDGLESPEREGISLKSYL